MRTIALLLLLLCWPVMASAVDWSQTKIAPPSQGLYLGQYEWTTGDIATVEAAAGMRTAFYSKSKGSWGDGYVNGVPHLNLTRANQAWAEGRVIVVQAFNTYPGPDNEHPTGFTIDKLLRGQYDTILKQFAKELRAFGKPVFFQVGREPNGVGKEWFGGFGPNGDKTFAWAVQNKAGYTKFTPPAAPSGAGNLYQGIVTATKCDGVERLAAAQRYYHDFFVRREQLKFLTFDTQGWSTPTPGQNELDALSHADVTYARPLVDNCQDFRNFYPGDAYVDWISFNVHFMDWLYEGWGWMPKPFPPQTAMLLGCTITVRGCEYPMQYWWTALVDLSSKINQVASTKPWLITELGFSDGMSQSSPYAAMKVTTGFDGFLSYFPQINGVSLWANSPYWLKKDVWPFDSLLRPNTAQGNALKAVIASHPGTFRGCVRFANGLAHPYCKETP